MGKRNNKITIWGFGRIARNVISILGKDNIEAIVDSNPEKLKEGNYNDIPIISFVEYKENHSYSYILITPAKYKDIVDKLEENNIYSYFIWNEEKLTNMSFMNRHYIFGRILDCINKNKRVYLYGLSLFGVMLYKKLKDAGILVQYLPDSNHAYLQKILFQEKEIAVYDGDVENEIIIQLSDTIRLELKNKNHVISYRYMNHLVNTRWEDKLQKYQNIALPEEELFIIATGPSLLLQDLELLKEKRKKTMGMNWLFKIFDQTQWRPDYYVVSDQKMVAVIDQMKNNEDIFQGIHTFISDAWLDFWRKDHPENFVGYCMKYDPQNIRFSEDISEVVYSGMTVMYVCLQLAVFMGYKRIYLLGCDFNYEVKEKQHCYEETKVTTDFDYDTVSQAYHIAKEYCDCHGIKIYNATRGGKLETFKRVDFDTLF